MSNKENDCIVLCEPPFAGCIRARDKSAKHQWLTEENQTKSQSSFVWKHFKLYAVVLNDGNPAHNDDGSKMLRVRCSFPSCQRGELIYGSSSTHGMRGHLRAYHLTDLDEPERKELLSSRKRKVEGSSDGSGRSNKKVSAFFMKKNAASAEQERSLLELIVVDGLPLSFAESPRVERFCKKISDGFELPTRKKLSETILPEAYEEFCKARKNVLKNVGKIAITVDEWSHPASKRSLLAVRAHGWTDSFERLEVTLDVPDFYNAAHNAESVRNAVVEAVQSCGMEPSCVEFIVSDGASVMLAAARKLNVAWVHCLAHRLNLLVQDFLKDVPEYKGIIDKVKANARLMHQSIKYSSKLELCQRELGLPVTRLVRSCPTRWNSALHMLMSAVNNNDAINGLLELTRKEQKSAAPSLNVLSKEELFTANAIITVLSPFEELPKIASTAGECISSYAAGVIGLQRVLESHSSDPLSHHILLNYVEKAAMLLDERFFGEESILLNDVILVALYLDPRFSGREDILSVARWKTAKDKFQAEAVKNLPQNRTEEGILAVNGFVANETTIGCPITSVSSFLSKKRTDRAEKERNVIEVEDIIFNEALRSFCGNTVDDVAAFWRKLKSSLPVMYDAARVYLAAPISSADVERLFSVASSLAEQRKRNRLGSVKMAQLIMLREYFMKGKSCFTPHIVCEESDSSNDSDDE